VPELMEMFLPATRSLISDKNHGIHSWTLYMSPLLALKIIWWN
jgi:hypothetical protein